MLVEEKTVKGHTVKELAFEVLRLISLKLDLDQCSDEIRHDDERLKTYSVKITQEEVNKVNMNRIAHVLSEAVKGNKINTFTKPDSVRAVEDSFVVGEFGRIWLRVVKAWDPMIGNMFVIVTLRGASVWPKVEVNG